MPTVALTVVIVFLIIVVGAATANPFLILVAVALVLLVNPLIWDIRKKSYFKSEEFNRLRAQTWSLVAEHNAMVGYIAEVRAKGSFELGASDSGQHAHLGTSMNTSHWNYRRDRHVYEHGPHVHHASLQVVRNASMEPLRYVMKYFSIRPDLETLADVQRISGDIARLEAAVANVRDREGDILSRIRPPKFISDRYFGEFWNQVGVQLSPIRVPYPQYKFQYVSAGGNSSQQYTLEFNTVVLEALAQVLVERIRFSQSAAGQRALMTQNLRNFIKARDGHQCRSCGVSVRDEPHLLLEVDHITPVSKGGLSVPENLQTLCWRCNRTKGAKLPVFPQHPAQRPALPPLPPRPPGFGTGLPHGQ